MYIVQQPSSYSTLAVSQKEQKRMVVYCKKIHVYKKLQYKDNVYIIGKCKRANMGKIMLCDVTLPSSNLYRTQDPKVDVRKFLFEIKRLIFGEYLYLISRKCDKNTNFLLREKSQFYVI